MDVQEIVKKYLWENGFDGLLDPGTCGCASDDLFPCGGDLCHQCVPAYRHACSMCYASDALKDCPDDREDDWTGCWKDYKQEERCDEGAEAKEATSG